MCVPRQVLVDRKGLDVVWISSKMEKQSQPPHQRGPTAVSIHFVILVHPSHAPSESPQACEKYPAHQLCMSAVARHTYECTEILALVGFTLQWG